MVASESPDAETASLPTDHPSFSDEAGDDESAAENAALAEPRSPLEEGATAAVIASADDAAAEADEAAAEAEEAFPDEPEAAVSAPESSTPKASTIDEAAPDEAAPEATASATDGTAPPLETAPASASTDAQVLPEQVADDSVRQGQQDGVISAPFPAPAPAGEELINGQTQEEQDTSKR